MRIVAIGLMCGLSVGGVAHAAIERPAHTVAASPIIAVPIPPLRVYPSAPLQADRPDFRLPFDYRPAHPSDEIHRFRSEDLLTPDRS